MQIPFAIALSMTKSTKASQLIDGFMLNAIPQNSPCNISCTADIYPTPADQVQKLINGMRLVHLLNFAMALATPGSGEEAAELEPLATSLGPGGWV